MGIAIELEGMCNVRDLGGTPAEGGKVKGGLLFRSDQLWAATDADKEALKALGVRTVIDFRSQAECDEKPDPAIDGITVVKLPVIQDVRAGITRDSKSNMGIRQMLAQGKPIDPAFVDAYMQNMYRGFVTDEFAHAQYSRFVDEVIASVQRDEGVLWHCTAGKDRAGFATAILLKALGASPEDIMEDYLLTNERVAGITEQILATVGKMLSNEEAREALRRFFHADASYLQAAFDCAEERYGTFERFMEDALGIDGEKRALMRSLLCA